MVNEDVSCFPLLFPGPVCGSCWGSVPRENILHPGEHYLILAEHCLLAGTRTALSAFYFTALLGQQVLDHTGCDTADTAVGAHGYRDLLL